MRLSKVVVAVAALLIVAAAASSVQAAPITLTLVRTSVLYNEDPPGAPLPLGRTQYDAGDVLSNGKKVGEYVRVKDVHSGTINTAAVKLTLFFPVSSGAPNSITLQGAHDFNSGNESGSISAASFGTLTGVGFTLAGATSALTLNLP
ncbi:MAG TPA: hypothetical protein VH417_03275 [Vicinamibacterales bacterium]|jgi:hypothetical protein